MDNHDGIMARDHMLRTILITIVLSCCLVQTLNAKALDPKEVPDPLKPWVKWVLHGEEQRNCPFLYNLQTQRDCVWPSNLDLRLNETKGKFAQSWLVYIGSWVIIPGDVKRWPQNVTIDGKSASVSNRHGRPQIFVTSGKHTIKGDFLWDRLPEVLFISPKTGIIKLVVKDNRVNLPNLHKNGQLWLHEQHAGQSDRAEESDKLELKVFRKIIDDVPLKITTHIELNVSGTHREVLLGTVLLDGFIPLRLDSPLPARIEANGRLRVQIRPGHWTIKLTARHPTEISQITLSRSIQPWPRDEVWVFEAQDHLRMVEIQGVTTIDPRQTNLPGNWMQLPAFTMKADDKMIFKTIRRGDPDPEPDKLTLNREIWLDFGGTGYTVKDKITGTMTQGQRIEAQPELELGRVTINGQAQFITRLPNSRNQGVEVRRGNINMVAESRYVTALSRLPASGWEQDFQGAKATVHLPPGWKIFSATGVDNRPGTWLQRWTLLDLFIVLIIAVAIWRLWGVLWGILALVTLGIIWHQPGAPQYVWLNILAAVALLRVLPHGRFKITIAVYRYLSLIALLLFTIPFMVQEVRSGLFPVLELPRQSMSPGIRSDAFVDKRVKTELNRGLSLEEMPAASPPPPSKTARFRDSISIPRLASELEKREQLIRFDPKANVQTGPGLPDWKWRSIYLSWNGPVQRDQTIGLILLSPGVNLVLHFLHVVLLAILALLMLGMRYTRPEGLKFNLGNLAGLMCIALLVFPGKETLADTTPLPEMLKQLKERLLTAPECLPICAQIPRMRLNISNNTLKLRLEVHVQDNVSLPIPAHTRNWMPTQVIVDGNQARGLMRTNNQELRINLKRGRHQIILSGSLGSANSLQLPLPLKPHRVDVEAKGWTVDGIHDNAIPDPQLQLSRNQPRASQLQMESLEPGALPPFVRITRTLRIGLDWGLETTVERLSSSDNAVVFQLLLLRGESVTTDGIRVENNYVQVNLPARVNHMSWVSVLEKQIHLTLEASNATDWVEIWRADISPIWHARPSGIPVIQHYSKQNQWLPEWRPWPGEKLRIEMLRPKGIDGQTVTIDNSQITVVPGNRAADVTLKFSLRSSQGGQHTIVLPNNARLQSVKIDNVQKPVRQNGRNVTLPISPRKQFVTLTWRTAQNLESLIHTPEVNIGLDNINHTTQLYMGADRWILYTGGPRLGPAVLFWGVLFIILCISIGLGQIKSIPLKSYHWFLLGIGLTQVPIVMALIVIGWLLSLMARSNLPKDIKPIHFNALQVILAIFTFIAVSALFYAIQQGLLGHPDMQITGNGSTPYQLNWYQDRANAQLPTAWVLSVPLFAYRLLMLAWALWIAISLINWLRWGWSCYTRDGLWRSINIFIKAKPAASSPLSPGDDSAGKPE